MEISKMLTISTGHISKETAEKLDNELYKNDMHLVVYDKKDYGWFIYLPDDFDIEDVIAPEDLMKCVLFAKDLGCDWLCLDRDGEELEYLDTYEW